MSIDKLKAYRATLSQAEKDALLESARVGRMAKAAFRLANKHLLKQDYLDAHHWASLGSKYGVRMPSMDDAVSAKGLRKAIKKVGIDADVFNEHYTSVNYFVENNPRWTAYAAQGLLLELLDSIKTPQSLHE